MKIIYNDFIPFKGFVAIMLFGYIFARNAYKPLPNKVIKHEEVHERLAKELGSWIKFYYLYIKEFLSNLIKYKDSNIAYRNISFEKEAYAS